MYSNYGNPTPAQLAALQPVRKDGTCLIVFLDSTGGLRCLDIAPPDPMPGDGATGEKVNFVPPSGIPPWHLPTGDELRDLLKTHLHLQTELMAVERHICRYFEQLADKPPP